MSGEPTWLLVYDIASRRRGQRVHYRLRKRALFVQESVAVLQLARTALDELLEELAEHLHEREDDLRVFRVDWPDGAWLSGPDARGNLLLPTPSAPSGTRKPRGRTP